MWGGQGLLGGSQHCDLFFPGSGPRDTGQGSAGWHSRRRAGSKGLEVPSSCWPEAVGRADSLAVVWEEDGGSVLVSP